MLDLIDALQPASTDRRTNRRYQPTFGTTCRIHSLCTQGLVWDISADGLGLLLPFAPNSGAILAIELETEAAPGILSVEIEVAHVRSLTTGDYFVGARFERPLTAIQIEPFISPAVTKPYFAVKAKSKLSAVST